ncbi:MAG TPA: hypothetical protein VE842_07075, partial [Pyrinomonadaceae bacterium]|nr:hypothetical protein [Pyrinomonadaceae bacterium]
GDIADKVRKEFPHGVRYDERDLHEDPNTSAFLQTTVESSPDGHRDGFSQATAARVVIEANLDEDEEQFESPSEFIRITDEH